MKLKLQIEEGGDWGLPAWRWDQKRKMKSGDEGRFSKWKIKKKKKWSMKIVATCLENEKKEF